MRAVLLDAMGTLLDLASPGDALVRELRSRGIELEPLAARRAFRAEILHYRTHHLEGRDEDSLADLRMRCACVLHANLPAVVREEISAAELVPVMLACLRFRVFADVPQTLARLREAGLSLIVLSNWDVSLRDVLDELGLLANLDGTVISAEVAHPKPHRAIFDAALALAGVRPEQALHVGDSIELDVQGALGAGITPVLLRRGQPAARHSAGAIAEISTLEQLPALALAGDENRAARSGG